MVTAGQFKKGVVIAFEGAHWIVEDYHVQKTAQRRPVLQTRLRHLKTGHVVWIGYLVDPRLHAFPPFFRFAAGDPRLISMSPMRSAAAIPRQQRVHCHAQGACQPYERISSRIRVAARFDRGHGPR
jgi:hypothetical protein